VLGPNGAGKSTAISILLELLEPDSEARGCSDNPRSTLMRTLPSMPLTALPE